MFDPRFHPLNRILLSTISNQTRLETPICQAGNSDRVMILRTDEASIVWTAREALPVPWPLYRYRDAR